MNGLERIDSSFEVLVLCSSLRVRTGGEEIRREGEEEIPWGSSVISSLGTLPNRSLDVSGEFS